MVQGLAPLPLVEQEEEQEEREEQEEQEEQEQQEEQEEENDDDDEAEEEELNQDEDKNEEAPRTAPGRKTVKLSFEMKATSRPHMDLKRSATVNVEQD